MLLSNVQHSIIKASFDGLVTRAKRAHTAFIENADTIDLKQQLYNLQEQCSFLHAQLTQWEKKK